jgi:hypothetical protein
LSHFIEKTSSPLAVRPMGAQPSTRVVALLAVTLVCAQMGELTKRITTTAFFIGRFSHLVRRFGPASTFTLRSISVAAFLAKIQIPPGEQTIGTRMVARGRSGGDCFGSAAVGYREMRRASGLYLKSKNPRRTFCTGEGCG